MNKKFTKLIAAFALLVFMMPSLAGWGQIRANYTWTTANGQLTTTTTSVTVNEVTWSFNPTWADNSKKYVSWIGGSQNLYQIGSAKNILTNLNLSTNGINGTITAVAVTWSSAAANTATLMISVGSTNFTCNGNNNSTSNSSTISTSTFNGSATGELNIDFAATTGIKFQQIVVTYTTGGGTTYSVNIDDNITGGSIIASPTSQQAGQSVTLTATPNSAYTFNNIATNWSVTYGDETVQVTPGDNNTATFEMPESDVTVSATFTAKPTHSITIASDIENGSVTASLESAYEGQTVTLTVNPSQGYELTNITVEDQSGNNVELNGYTFAMPNSNVFVNATFDLIPTTVSDELDRVFTGVASGAGYSSWSNKTGVSGAVYAGRSAGGNNSIQLRDSDNSGIISTTSGGKLRAVIVDWNTNTTNGRTLDIYGSNTAYNATSDLYNNETQGTKLGSIVKGTSTTLSISGNYKYIGIRSNNGAMYLNEIEIQWVQTNDPSILAENVNIEYNATSGAIEYEINNPATGGAVTAQVTNSNWLTLGEATNGAIPFTCSSNGSYASRPATVVLTYTYGDNQTTTATVTVTQAGVPYPATNYTLATSIESGRHYIIVNNESSKAMGMQNDNNRAAVDVEIDNGVATVSSADVYEFVINGPEIITIIIDEEEEEIEVYTIHDANAASTGFLYAASSGSNWLRTETHLDAGNNGKWAITFNGNKAVIKAQGTNSRNWMLYNTQNSFFSCYANTSQQVINEVYLYVKDETTPQYDFYKDIAKYTTPEENQPANGWNLIASPVASVTPSVENGLLSGTYDLYYFDQTGGNNGKEWKNYKANNFPLVGGHGYLYANSNDVTLKFTGTPNTSGEVSLTYSTANEDENMRGWNLVGNPFGRVAYISGRNFYRMNDARTEIVVSTTASVNPMEGVFVQAADADDNSITFSTTAPEGAASNENQNVVLNVVRNRGTVIDRAIVSFNDDAQLPKLMINENSTKLYITQDNKNYAVVRTEAQGEMPVNFRANEDGQYTLTVNPENTTSTSSTT